MEEVEMKKNARDLTRKICVRTKNFNASEGILRSERNKKPVFSLLMNFLDAITRFLCCA
jgi:hypothetical protein